MFDRLFQGRLFGLWHSLFFCLIFFTVYFGFSVTQEININTDLGELNPQQQFSNQTKAAIAELTDSIGSRVVLLITGPNEDSVLGANDQLRSGLYKLDGLRIHPEAETLATDLAAALIPYRFSLLTESQRQQLAQLTTNAIVQASKTELYSLTGVRLLPFNQDPLGWHSSFIQELFSSLQPSENSTSLFHSVVSFSIDIGANSMRRQESLIVQLEAIIEDLKIDYDVSIERSGIFFFSVDAAAESKKDISLITTASTIGLVLLLLLVFRSFQSLVIPVSSIILGVAFAFVVSHSIYGNVHILTIVFGASLIGIVVDYSLHYFYHVTASSDNRPALYRALSLSLLTSLIGYSSLGLSSLPALQKVAVFSCCGLFMAWLSVICIGQLNPHKNLKLDSVFLPAAQSWLSNLVRGLNIRGWLLICLCVLISTYTAAKLYPIFDDDPRVFFEASEQIIASEQAVAAYANDYEPGRFIIIQGESEEEISQTNQQLFSVIASETAIDPANLTSLFNWIPSTEQQFENYQLQSQLYTTNGISEYLVKEIGANNQISEALRQEYLAAENLFLTPQIIASLLRSSTPPLLINHDGLLSSFILIKKGTDSEAIEDVSKQIDGVDFVNTLQKTQDALEQQRFSAIKFLAVAYMLIAFLLIARYQSVWSAAMLLVPLTASALVLLICLGLGQALNLFHVMALFLVLGFGMDYTIFTREVDDMQAITLQAIFLSAITSLLSFGLLSISSIPVAYSFGTTLLIGNCFNLLGVFVYSHCLYNRDKA